MKKNLRSLHHLEGAVRFSPSAIKQAVSEVEGFNARAAIVITQTVGTMACAWVFAVIALISLPAAINSGQVIIIIAWTAQTFLQLVLLAVIMVGQDVQSKASDARSEKTFLDAEMLLDRLDLHTAGGIKDLHDSLLARLDALEAPTRPVRTRKKPA